MMELNYAVLFAVSAVTIIIGLILHQRTQPGFERVFLWGFLCGMYIICGFGSAYADIPHSYAVKYLVYVAAAGTGFTAVVGMLRAVGVRTCREIDWRLSRIDSTLASEIGFWFFLVSLAFPLIYPTIRLNLLWSPPMPDLQAMFNYGINSDKSLVERLVGYVTLLCYPVYLWRLHAYAKRPAHLPLAVFGPLYLIYCADSYIGRGSMLMGVALYAMLLGQHRPRARKYLALTLVAAAPLALIGFAEYARVRTGESLERMDTVLDEVSALVATETGLPLNAAVLVESAQHANLGDLALWAVTLPVPKVLTGKIVTFEANFDMAEIITNKPQGSATFSVTLPGIVGESIYFGGTSFYWLFAALTGGLFGLLCALCSRSNQLGGVTIYCVLLWAYMFSRAGLAAGLPLIINGVFPFLVVVVLVSNRGSANREHGVLLPLNTRRLVPTHDASQD
jgi:hypothetical protein